MEAMISRLSYYLSSSFELKVLFVIVHFRSLAFLHPYLVDFSALLQFLFFGWPKTSSCNTRRLLFFPFPFCFSCVTNAVRY